MKKIIITGASGLLGRAVRAAFTRHPADYDVLGLAFSRAENGLVPLDLLDAAQVERVFAEFKPDAVIHCAAERRPDVAAKFQERTTELNAEVPRRLAVLAARLRYRLIYISSDYVFDGTSPPYAVDAPAHPLNLYGRTKLDGERAVLSVQGADAVVLRVPVLYGPAPSNAESSINLLLDVVRDQSGKQYKMDDDQIRYPTNVEDVARFIVRLVEHPPPAPPIVHFTSPTAYTKYALCLLLARLLGLPHAHIAPDAPVPASSPTDLATAPAPAATEAVTRPHDCQLDVRMTEEVVLGGERLTCVGFEEWWSAYLGVVPKVEGKREGGNGERV